MAYVDAVMRENCSKNGASCDCFVSSMSTVMNFNNYECTAQSCTVQSCTVISVSKTRLGQLDPT